MIRSRIHRFVRSLARLHLTMHQLCLLYLMSSAN
jgi:hypothetical protein